MDPVAEKLLVFAMVLTRISAFVLVVPVFSWQSIPVRIKIATCLLLTIFFVAVKSPQINIETFSVIRVIMFMAIEATYGLALGLIMALVFSAVALNGRIVERQMGMALANVVDPLTGERSKPLSMLLDMLLILMFLSANGHHLFILTISRSYDVFTVGTMPSIATLTAGVIEAGSTLLIAGLRLAAPMLAAFLLLLVALGVLAKIAPEMNILFLSLPARVGLGLVMSIFFIPFIYGFISEFADWMNKLLPL